MGNWAIYIEGTGQHHNGKDEDADNIADECVQMLRRAGQNVEHASFTSGGRRVLPTVGSIRPKREPQ